MRLFPIRASPHRALPKFPPSDLIPMSSSIKPERESPTWLLFLLTLLFVGAFGSLFFIEGEPTFEHLKGLLEILLGPLVALVSAATGFYFGAQSGNKSNTPG